MNGKYKNKYRIASHRKPGWDYSSNGHYFITLVVQYRHSVLGHIEKGNMILNPWGKIVLAEWNKSFEMRSELFCDIFIIMPNHLHAIVTIDNDKTAAVDETAVDETAVDETAVDETAVDETAVDETAVETHGRASLQQQQQQQQQSTDKTQT